MIYLENSRDATGAMVRLPAMVLVATTLVVVINLPEIVVGGFIANPSRNGKGTRPSSSIDSPYRYSSSQVYYIGQARPEVLTKDPECWPYAPENGTLPTLQSPTPSIQQQKQLEGQSQDCVTSAIQKRRAARGPSMTAAQVHARSMATSVVKKIARLAKRGNV